MKILLSALFFFAVSAQASAASGLLRAAECTSCEAGKSLQVSIVETRGVLRALVQSRSLGTEEGAFKAQLEFVNSQRGSRFVFQGEDMRLSLSTGNTENTELSGTLQLFNPESFQSIRLRCTME